MLLRAVAELRKRGIDVGSRSWAPALNWMHFSDWPPSSAWARASRGRFRPAGTNAGRVRREYRDCPADQRQRGGAGLTLVEALLQALRWSAHRPAEFLRWCSTSGPA